MYRQLDPASPRNPQVAADDLASQGWTRLCGRDADGVKTVVGVSCAWGRRVVCPSTLRLFEHLVSGRSTRNCGARDSQFLQVIQIPQRQRQRLVQAASTLCADAHCLVSQLEAGGCSQPGLGLVRRSRQVPGARMPHREKNQQESNQGLVPMAVANGGCHWSPRWS